MMPKISFDFNIHFWLGLAIFVASAITSGTIHLTNAVPADWIPVVTAWAGIISVVGTGYLTAALGLHNASPEARRDLAANVPNTMVVTTNGANKISVANKLAAMPEIQNVISTPAIAAATPSDKVIGVASDAVDAPKNG